MVETNGSTSSGASSQASGGSDPAAEDPELAAALDSFVDWAWHDDCAPEQRRLPPLQLSEGIRPGAVLGDYELVRRLGVGGMGVVFEGRQRSVMGRRVAIKVLRSFFATERLAKRFEREIATVAELDHPGIVPIVDARVEGGTPYYVMKFIPGLSLAELVKRLRRRSGMPSDSAPLRTWVAGHADETPGEPESSSSPDETSAWEASYPRFVASMGLQVAEALQYAHDHGFVHRDVKPGNVVVTPRGRPVLLDFGLATGEHDDALTQTGEFLGTLAYASPEQVQGRPVDARADVYSLGATLYELLTLRRPFEAHDRSELMRRIDREAPPRIDSETPADLRTIVLCALSKSPGQRYATAGEMAQDLRALLAGKPIQRRPPGILAKGLQWIRNHPLLATAAGVAVLFLGGIRVADHVRARAEVRAGTERLAACLSALQDWNARLQRYVELEDGEPSGFLQLEELRAELTSSRSGIAQDFEDAETALVGAFAHVAHYAPARRELARLHASRMAQALSAYEDLNWPDRIERLEQAVRRYDDAGRHARLLDPMGSIRLSCDAPGATLEVFRDGEPAQPLYSGPAPFSAELPEGSYLARVSAPGWAEARLPFLVRRAAAYTGHLGDSARPARELSVRLLAEAEVTQGFVYVPAGETLLSNDPPVWKEIPGYLIQEFETSYADLLRWLESAERIGPAGEALIEPFLAILPRDSQGAHVVHGPDGTWSLRADVSADLPVRGITPLNIGYLVQLVDLLDLPRPSGWHPSLPRVSEWVRAARGADGRPYPWGTEFESERCVSYLSSGFFGLDARPLPVGYAQGDVSPFGVHDLSGSVAELTLDLQPPLPGHYVVCGGSFRTVEPRELITTARHSIPNEALQDVGFRFVIRPLPDWYQLPDEAPVAFRDDFDRPDNEAVGDGWVELVGTPFSYKNNPGSLERSFIEDGRLVCEGGSGDFSDVMNALHRIHPPSTRSGSGYVARAVIRGTSSEPVERTLGRGTGLRLYHGFLARDSHSLGLLLGFDGRTQLVVSGGEFRQAVGGTLLDPSGPLTFEILVEGRQVSGRIWPVGSERPAEPLLALTRSCDDPPPRYVLIQAPNYAGARVEVDWVSVEPVPTSK